MTIAQSLLPEFDHEMACTRRTLERVPEDKLDWRPHPKSNTIGWLAAHLADIPGLGVATLAHDTFDFNPTGDRPFRTEPATSRQDALDRFDRNLAEARRLLLATDDESFMQSFTFLDHGQPLLTMPRVAVVRSFVLNHTIHHRAQLCVYYRLNGVPVPALYGPSGDER